MKLMSKDKVPAVVHSNAMRMVKQVYICYGAALYSDHGLVEELGYFLDKYQQAIKEFFSEMSYVPQLPTYTTKTMVPCLIVGQVQGHIANWINKQWSSRGALVPPLLSTLFKKMKLRYPLRESHVRYV